MDFTKALVLTAGLALVCHPASAAPRKVVHRKPAVRAAVPPPAPLTDDERITQVLNRLGFGPRPGDIEQVRAMGVDKYIDEQLHPERIPDADVDTQLASLPTLWMAPYDLVAAYNAPRPKLKVDGQAVAELTPADIKNRQLNGLNDRAVPDLQLAKVFRASESNRQLLEVMVDFWTNHFNIDVRKGQDKVFKTADDRDVIRPLAFGKFRDILGASAKSPAMLVYLDNALNHVVRPPRPKNVPDKQWKLISKTSASNENYGREIMELHTLGVDGGYTQADVQEVARCFTGWTYDRKTGEFKFDPKQHDDGVKMILGNRIPAGGGQQDGETVLDILASHVSTAKFVSRKLCRRFISDTPPQSIVNRAADRFIATGGDIREVVRTIITSPEFFSRAAYRAKIKSPFEFVVSSIRALDGHVTLVDPPAPPPPASIIHTASGTTSRPKPVRRVDRNAIVRQVDVLGEPLFQYQFPTGYSEDSRKWVTAGSLINRMNFGSALAGGRFGGVSVPIDGIVQDALGSPLAELNRLEVDTVQNQLSLTSRNALIQQANRMTERSSDPRLLAALVLGSPEFQRR